MTEDQWLACTDPQPMLDFLLDRASNRKLRLFACTCCRAFIHHADERCRDALAVADAFAEGLATAKELETARRVAYDVFCEFEGVPEKVGNAVSLACCHEDLGRNVVDVAHSAHSLAVVGVERSFMKAARILERRKQCRWLRDIFGSPFRPVTLHPLWLTPGVANLGAAAYEVRALPSGELDSQRLAVLADALEEAGCADPELLGHLRSPGPHVRWCWALDLILGKE